MGRVAPRRGSIIFGVVTVVVPDISLVALVLVFGAYAFADGVLNGERDPAARRE